MAFRVEVNQTQTGMEAIMDSRNHAIDTHSIYPRNEFLRLMGWSKQAWRTAKDQGLLVIYAGGRCYVRGNDVARYLACLHRRAHQTDLAPAENAELVERTIAGRETEQCLIEVMHQIAHSLFLGLSLDELSNESSELLRQCVDVSARIEGCVKSQSEAVRGHRDVRV
jgi:hypothetical protein